MKIPNKYNRLGISNGNGLDFYAPFDSNLNDVVNGITGSSNGYQYFSIQEDTTSNIGKYLRGQITTNYQPYTIFYANTENMFKYGTGDFSISYWIQAPKWSDYTNNCVLSKKANDSDTGFVNFRNGSQTQMDMRVAGTNNLNTSTSVTNSRWISWIFIRKNGVGYWYRNGILDNSGACTGSANSNDILRIGYHAQWQTKAYYNLKALRIFNRALTSKQIDDLANEFDVKYYIQANDQTLNFYPFNQSQLFQISTPIGTSGYTFNYQIISGTLPSNLTFYSSGYIYGHTNEDATYPLVVRVSSTSTELLPKDFNVTVIGHKDTVLTVTSPQTFNFITQASETKAIDCTTQGYSPTVNITDGILPQGVNLVPTSTGCNIVTTGSQNSASSSSVVTAWTTQYHQTPVNATFNINVALNQITASNQTAKFFTELGTQTYQVKYFSQKTITPVFTLSGTLPSGITFDASTGTFTYDGTNTTAGTATVQVTIASSTGRSVTATAEITLGIVEGKNYFTIEAVDSNITIASNYNYGGSVVSDLYYKTNNDSNWQPFTWNSTSITLNNIGDYVQFWNKNSLLHNTSDFAKNCYFTSTGATKVYGDIQSLMNFSNTVHRFGFYAFFSNLKLTDAGDLILSATSAGDYAYNNMFNGCTLLNTPQILTASFGSTCCSNMFVNSNFKTIEFTVNSVNSSGLQYFCRNNKTLESAIIHGTAGPTFSWNRMFDGCTKLSLISVDFLGWGTNSNWVNNVASSGTFYKHSSLSNIRGINNIPSNWNIINKD